MLISSHSSNKTGFFKIFVALLFYCHYLLLSSFMSLFLFTIHFLFSPFYFVLFFIFSVLLTSLHHDLFFPSSFFFPLFITFRIRMIACSAVHTLAVSLAGDVFAFGQNTEGALGVGDIRSRYVRACV